MRIVELTDAQALETGIVENLQRRDVHPMEEANGYARLLALDEPKYSVEQIAAKVGKAPAFIIARLKLVELVPAVVEAFTQDEIGLGHALLLAKLQPAQQEEALAACYQEQYSSGSKAKRILLPVRNLHSGLSTTFCWSLPPRRSRKKTPRLCPMLARVLIARSAPATMFFCSRAYLRSMIRAPIQSATQRRSMRTFARQSRPSRSWFRLARLTDQQRTAAPQFRATSM